MHNRYAIKKNKEIKTKASLNFTLVTLHNIMNLLKKEVFSIIYFKESHQKILEYKTFRYILIKVLNKKNICVYGFASIASSLAEEIRIFINIYL